MATRKKENKKPGKSGKIALGAFVTFLLIILVVLGIGFLNASLVRIRRAEVVLPNLPVSFDGTTLLYASDIDLCGLNTPSRAAALFNQLQSLKPDLLILGGDYNSTSLLDRLNRADMNIMDEKKILDSRSDFFHYIGSFQAPLGKYAIPATEDVQWQNLKLVMKENGIQPLFNEKININSGKDTLWLAGISGQPSGLNDSGRAFSRDDCVIVIAEGPDILPILLTSEAKDGDSWADMVLCGHTHGGQIKLFGRTMLSFSDAEKRIDTGWNTQAGLPILNTEGVGCERLNLRLGTEPEVWLITLHRE